MKIIDKIKDDTELWDLFTKKEEYNPPFLDMFERFPYYLSKHRDIFTPIVSKNLMENGYRPTYPSGKKFAVCLTHDIDVIYQNWLGCAISSTKSMFNGNLKGTIKYPLYALNKKKHPFWNFKQIMELEDKYDAKSSFYFLALEPGDRDYKYDIEEVADDIKYISDSGWEVGLHGSHEAYYNFDKLTKEKDKLETITGKNVVGYRNHFLHFKTPDTWEILKKAGFKYDTTFGYADCAGFRNGMCYPFKPFNLYSNKEIGILEIPLIIMDGTLFSYMRLNQEKAWNVTKKLIDTVEQYNGVITILWHNTYMQESLEFYERILNYCYGKQAWMTSGENIMEWWNDNVRS